MKFRKRRISHWSPKYIRDRCLLALRQMQRPSEPWLVHGAIDFLNGWLLKTDVGIEWGSGRSTEWFATRVGYLTSIEHNKEWYQRTKFMLKGIGNVDLLLQSIGSDKENKLYSSVVLEHSPEKSLDFALIDGRLRDKCALAVLDYIKPGGMLIIDNIDRYLPNKLNTPASSERYGSDEWKEFSMRTAEWRMVWYCDGITATALLFKPPNA